MWRLVRSARSAARLARSFETCARAVSAFVASFVVHLGLGVDVLLAVAEILAAVAHVELCMAPVGRLLEPRPLSARIEVPVAGGAVACLVALDRVNPRCTEVLERPAHFRSIACGVGRSGDSEGDEDGKNYGTHRTNDRTAGSTGQSRSNH
jgi:hypothetical protein